MSKITKNLFIAAHGRRIKNSFFKLEPNVNVYMKCSDTISYISILRQCVMMKYLLNDQNIDYLDKIIKKMSSKNLIYRGITYDSTKEQIKKRIDEIKNRTISTLTAHISLYQNKIQKLDEFYDKVNRKRMASEDAKYDTILENIKESIKKFVMIIGKIEIIIKNILENKDNYEKFERMRSVHKPSYEILQRYKKIKERFKKEETKMRKKYKGYDPEFDLCVFSGNLDHSIRKYTHGKICSMEKMDLNICPNIEFSADNAKGFRDFISEQGIHMEIKKGVETYMTHEDIIKSINNYIMNVFKKRADYLYKKIMDNIGLSLLCNKDLIYLKDDIRKQVLKNVTDNTFLQEKIKKKYKILTSIKQRLLMRGNRQTIIPQIDSKINKMKDMKNKLRESLKEINKKKDFLNSNYTINVDNDGGNKVFYPMGDWSDCNIKTKFYDVVNAYLRGSEHIFSEKFKYYNVVKRRFLSEEECITKYRKERKKYLKYNRISLRDVLLYLHNRYNMNTDPNIRLELTISSCKSDLDVIKDIYGTCKLGLSDYLHKKIKMGDSMNSLREYDLERDDKNVKRVKRSCSTILKKDGCPSHCEMPKDESRKTCIVKSRRRKKRKYEKPLEREASRFPIVPPAKKEIS